MKGTGNLSRSTLSPESTFSRIGPLLTTLCLIASWVTISGDLNSSSEWYPGLSAERLDLLKRTMPSHGLPARPVDLFESDLPGVWLLTDDRHSVRRDVIGLFNWDDGEKFFSDSLEKLGLDGKTDYVAFDYWKNALVPTIKRQLQIIVPGQSCCVLAVRPVANHPQLISTSRHITQGIVDVLEEKWDSATKTLSGRSKVVGGDPYELRIVVPDNNWSAAAPMIADSITQNDNLVRVTIPSANSGEVSWSVKFK